MTMLNLIQMIISILSGIIAILSVLVLIVKWIKNGNLNKVINLLGKIPTLVTEAEQMFGNGHGTDKFKWVMTMLKNEAYKTKTKINDEILERKINEVVDATNTVNVDKFPFSKSTQNGTEIDDSKKNNESVSSISQII